ncbi:MAG: ABC transporter permease subunit [Planctomycetota bacterium]|nr:MAG: ABC transporter permease subunit [Planctomycetota bacterium]
MEKEIHQPNSEQAPQPEPAPQLSSLEEELSKRPSRTYWQIVRKEFMKNKMAVFGAVMVLFMFAVAIYAPFLANDKPYVIYTRFFQDYAEIWQNLRSLYTKVAGPKGALTQMQKEEKIWSAKKRLKEKKLIDAYKIAQKQIPLKVIREKISQLTSKAQLQDLLKEIQTKRIRPFYEIEDEDEADQPNRNLLEEALASNSKLALSPQEIKSFIYQLRHLDTQFDRLSHQELLRLLQAGASLEELKTRLALERITPLNTVTVEFEEKLDEVLKGRPIGEQEEIKNYLANFNYFPETKSELLKYIEAPSDLDEFSRQSFLAKHQGFQDYKIYFPVQLQLLSTHLGGKHKKTLDELSSLSSKITGKMESGQLPEQEELDQVVDKLALLKPQWIDGKGVVAKKELVRQRRYPLFRSLSYMDIFFMTLFALFLLSPIPFALFNLFSIDPFLRSFIKAFILLFIPAVLAFLWWLKYPEVLDKRDYRKIIQNFEFAGDYAYIPPIFYGPYTEEKNYAPPSWAEPEEFGLIIQRDSRNQGLFLTQKLIPQKDGSYDCAYFQELRKQGQKVPPVEVLDDLPERVYKGKIFILPKKNYAMIHSVIIEPGGVLIVEKGAKIVNFHRFRKFYWQTEDHTKIGNYHILGTDGQGRDIFTRLIWGARISLSVGFVAVGIYVLIGIVLGSLAGFFGGWVDMVISRLIEIMICFPTLILIITIIAVLPSKYIDIWNGMLAIMVVIGVTGWTGVARLIRGEFLRLRNLDFVVAGKALGVSNFRLIFRHIVPNALAPVLVSATFGIASAILVESSLSFLGLGVQPPAPTWGAMLSEAQSASSQYWWLAVFPGTAIFLTVTVYNLVGEGIRDALDPRLKER